MLFLDLSSAFDAVDGMAFNLFHSYLTERSKTFSVGDTESDTHSISCSVPKDQFSGLWNSWPALRTICSNGTRSTTIWTLMTINIRTTCTPNLVWRLQVWRVWLTVSLTCLARVHYDYNLTPRKLSWSSLDSEQWWVTGDYRSLSTNRRQHRLLTNYILRRHITQEAMEQLICSLILSRIDYCNSILIGLPASSILHHFSVFWTMPLG